MNLCNVAPPPLSGYHPANSKKNRTGQDIPVHAHGLTAIISLPALSPHSKQSGKFMAIKATIFKANLQIADMERHYYQDHTLTLARHPSETDERMMVRLLAFAMHAHEHLEFGQGMTNDEEADLWLKDMTGAIKLWIDVGIPDEKLIRKACGRAEQVVVYCYGGRVADMWFAQNSAQFERQKNLSIVNLPVESTRALAKLAQRSMNLQCTIQDGQVWLSDGNASVQVERVMLKTPEKRK
jgi:uncharacterized protein YaeQ